MDFEGNNTMIYFSMLICSVEEEPIEPIKEENPTEWWMQICPEEELNNIEYSSKLMLLFSILAECEACGDKLLVFSQSLFSLDVIEHFLAMIDENTQNPNPDAKLGGFSGSWTRGIDYFRLDGSTNIETRNANCNSFNSEENSQARLFLISTRAGGLGINLVAANRVIIFDASWNPSHDVRNAFYSWRCIHQLKFAHMIISCVYILLYRFKVFSGSIVLDKRNHVTFIVLSPLEQWKRKFMKDK